MIHPSQLEDLIRNVLNEFDPNLAKENAIQLLLLTCATESQAGYYITQVKGPALGIFQMEPFTENDIWEKYISVHPDWKEKLEKIVPKDLVNANIKPLEYNLYYQIVMCRLYYRRIKESIPSANDVESLANYWKKYYNTPLGKGDPAIAAQNYRKLFKK